MKTDFRNVLDGIRQRPSMYFAPLSVDVVAAYVQGYEAGSDGQQLSGFQLWLAEQLGQGQNLALVRLGQEACFSSSRGHGARSFGLGKSSGQPIPAACTRVP